MPKLTPIPGIATMDMVLVTMVTTADPTMVATTGHTDTDIGDERRGRLRLNLKLTQKLKLIPGTGPMDMDTEAMDIGARMSRPSNQN